MDIRISLLIASLFLFASQGYTAVLAMPVANDVVRTVPANVPITINVLSSASHPSGAAIRLVADGVTQPNNGSITVNSDGGIRYTPNSGFIGEDRFSYMIATELEESEHVTGEVIINVVPANLSGGSVVSNTASVAQALDSICTELTSSNGYETNTGTAELARRCQALLTLAAVDEVAAHEAMQQIAPEETLTLSRVGSNATEFQTQMVGDRLMELGKGISAMSTGRRLSWSNDRAPGGAAGDNSILARMGVFASIQLEDAEKDRTDEEAGFDYSANGITAGMDFAMSPDWFLGGAFGWTQNDLDYKNEGGAVTSDIYTFIGYSTYHHNNFSFDAQLGYGSSTIDISRRIAYDQPGVDPFEATTSGSTSGKQWFITAEMQYLYTQNAFSLYPSARLNFLSSHVDSYADNNAGGWEVSLSEQSVDQLNFQAGFQGTYAIATNWGVFIPHFEASMIADLNTRKDDISGAFAFAPESSESFSLTSEAPESLYYQLGLGFSVSLPRGLSAYSGVRTTLGYQNYRATQFQAGFRKEL